MPFNACHAAVKSSILFYAPLFYALFMTISHTQRLKICDEIFGAGNFVAVLIVNSNSSKNNAKKASVSHEYILCFVKDFTKETKDWKIKKQQVKAYESSAKQSLKMNLTEDEIHHQRTCHRHRP